MNLLDWCLSKDVVPTSVMRMGIRYLLRQRLRQQRRLERETNGNNKLAFIESLKQTPIALSTDTANEQHYEVPTQFYHYTLGPRLKYSSAWWDSDTHDLGAAEENMLRLYCERAQLQEGEAVLDLGCGWGSLCLYIAEHYPNNKVYALSNSRTQQAYIQAQAQEKGFDNLQVFCADINEFSTELRFDKIMTIEMLEHMRNYQQLLSRCRQWLHDDGLLFIHIFCHHHFIYPFVSDESWMAQHFFKDGIMPSEDLLLFFQQEFEVQQRWRVNGEHYAKTCEQWSLNQERYRDAILALFADHYSEDDAMKRYHYWRLFFLACAELFAYDHGNEWFVVHYLLKPR